MTRYPAWLAGAAALAVAVAVLGWLLPQAEQPAPAPPPSARPTASQATSAADPATSAEPPAFGAVSAPAAEVLSGWDRRRAAAYADGDVAALRALYVPAALAAKADQRLLRGYLRRGLRVEGMRMQILRVDVLDRSADRLRLRVTDRLAGAVVLGAGRPRTLPRDRASTHVVELRRSERSGWRVLSVSR